MWSMLLWFTLAYSSLNIFLGCKTLFIPILTLNIFFLCKKIKHFQEFYFLALELAHDA